MSPSMFFPCPAMPTIRRQRDAVRRFSPPIASPCHGPDGKGNQALGAPNLTDELWLYGGDKATVIETITNSRGGVMPAWTGRLDPATIKELAIYVHSLGGGQ